MQIPEGALPLEGKPPTLAHQITLGPYSCHVSTMHFYFPRPGTFAQPTPSVTRGGCAAWLPAAPPRPLTVQGPGEAAAPADGGVAARGAAPFDWKAFVRRAPPSEVLRYLETGDLSVADPLSLVTRHCGEAGFFSAAVAALSSRGVYDEDIWKWAVKHGHEAALRQLLPGTDLVRDLGVPLVAPLVTVGDVAGDAGYVRHLEYYPWVNSYCRPIPDEDGEPAWFATVCPHA
jgi:hypothetical protein